MADGQDGRDSHGHSSNFLHWQGCGGLEEGVEGGGEDGGAAGAADLLVSQTAATLLSHILH